MNNTPITDQAESSTMKPGFSPREAEQIAWDLARRFELIISDMKKTNKETKMRKKHMASSAMTGFHGERLGTKWHYTIEECKAARRDPYFRWRNENERLRYIKETSSKKEEK